MDKKSIQQVEQRDEATPSLLPPPLLPPLTRRSFLAGAATCAAVAPTMLQAAVRELGRQTLLHVATREAHTGESQTQKSHTGESQTRHVHTFALTSDACTLLGTTAVDSFAALAVHPALPVLYVARDCREWENLPRGIIESYAVEGGAHPLRLLAQTPMALSATGPRSLAVSSSGRYLLVSASTGGAWNSFALDHAGIPVSVAIARKETGTMLDAHTVSLPTPHSVVFSPHEPFALGVDPGSGCMTLLQPSSESIAVLARCQAPHGLTHLSPAWTSDGRHIVVANAQHASLSIYEMSSTPGKGSNAGFRLLGTTPTVTPVTALLAHPSQPTVFTSRSQGSGSRLEIWKVDRSRLRLVSDTWISNHVVALAQNAGILWALAQDCLIRIPIGNLRTRNPFEVPLPMRGVQEIVAQSIAAHSLDNV